MSLLLDEMYSSALARALTSPGSDTLTVGELGLAGRPDADVFAAAIAEERVLVTENVADFVRIAGDHLAAGRQHPGLLMALSSRFSRRPAGWDPLVAAIQLLKDEPLGDQVVSLQPPDDGRPPRRTLHSS